MEALEAAPPANTDSGYETSLAQDYLTSLADDVTSLTDDATCVSSSDNTACELPPEAVSQIFESAITVIPAPSTDDSTDSAVPTNTTQQNADMASAALNLTETVLVQATSIDEATADAATELLNFVMDQPSVVETSGAQLEASIETIGNKVLAGQADMELVNDTSSVVITTKNVNITAEKRKADKLADTPAQCQTDSVSNRPVEVELVVSRE